MHEPLRAQIWRLGCSRCNGEDYGSVQVWFGETCRRRQRWCTFAQSLNVTSYVVRVVDRGFMDKAKRSHEKGREKGGRRWGERKEKPKQRLGAGKEKVWQRKNPESCNFIEITNITSFSTGSLRRPAILSHDVKLITTAVAVRSPALPFPLLKSTINTSTDSSCE